MCHSKLDTPMSTTVSISIIFFPSQFLHTIRQVTQVRTMMEWTSLVLIYIYIHISTET